MKAQETQLNTLATLYITNGEQTEDLVKAYKIFNAIWSKKYGSIAKYDIRNHDEAEVREQYEKVFFNSLKKYNPSKGVPFMPFLRGNLNRKALDMCDKLNRQQKYLYGGSMRPKKDDEDEELDPLSLVRDTVDVEETVVNGLYRKSNDEKKELTSYFMKAVSDPLTKQAMLLIFEEDELGNPIYENMNQVADKLGIQRIQLVRKFNKVKKLYDESRFGTDYKAYLV